VGWQGVRRHFVSRDDIEQEAKRKDNMVLLLADTDACCRAWRRRLSARANGASARTDPHTSTDLYPRRGGALWPLACDGGKSRHARSDGDAPGRTYPPAGWSC